MTKLLGLGVVALAFAAEHQIPKIVLGKWTVGQPYDLGQPVGLDDKQEAALIGLAVRVSPNQITVCGREVPITSVEVDHLASGEFLAKYNFAPNLIGLSGADVLDIHLNKLHSSHACGEFADPGTHILIDKRHAVLEVGNDYLRLTKE